MSISESSQPTSQPRPAPLRLEYLDGLRGLAALYVTFCHTDPFCGGRFSFPTPVARVLSLAGYGHYAVSVFIVLSGYCLMLPVVRTADGRLRGGTGGFLLRRVRRILPPYYAALILSLLLIVLIPGLQQPAGVLWDNALPALGKKDILAHALLLHNLRPEWVLKIDSPLWSVATEWQIYFVFPVLLLPLWRRFGSVAALVSGFAVGLLPHFVLPFYQNLDWAGPWYLGLFALGMAGASVTFSPRAADSGLPLAFFRKRGLWAGVCAASTLAFVALEAHDAQWGIHHFWFMDTLTGLAALGLIVFCALVPNEMNRGKAPLALRILEARWAVTLGTFSYSLYLIHFPLLALFRLGLTRLHLSPPVWIGTELVLGMPLVLLAAYGFHLAFERPFLQRRNKETAAELARDAALSPAP